MTDADIQTFLEKINLVHLLPTFQAQKIDDTSILVDLNEEEINVLTNSSIGDKIKLKRAIKLIINEERNANETESTLSEDKELPYSQKRQKLSPPQRIPDSLSTDCYQKEDSVSIESLPVYLVNQEGDDLVLINQDSQQLLQNVSTATNFTISTPRSTPSCTSGESSLVGSINEQSCSSKSAISEFNLKDFLKEDIIGQAILMKPRLTNSDRDRLCEITVKYLMGKYGRLNNEALNIVANKIKEIFPNENSSIYFVPPIPKSRSLKNSSERSRGKLADKQRNLFYLINSIKKSENSRASAKENSKSDEDIIPQERNDISQEARDSYIWLKNNIEPTSEVLQHWKNSYPIRKFGSTETIEAFMEKWPALKTPLAPELVTLDFAMMHPKINDNFHQEQAFNNLWETVRELRQKSLSATESTLMELLDAEITTNSKTAIQLHLLPALVPPKTRISLGKSNWKPSIAEAREAFIIHVKIPGDVQVAKKNQIDLFFKKNLTVQPYIVMIGPTLSNITGALVVINNHDYKCVSVLDALDFCFKAYQILDANYPKQCAHLWYLIQWRVYSYFHKNDPTITHINDLL